MSHEANPAGSSKRALIAIGLALAVYGVAVVLDGPQAATRLIVKGEHNGDDHVPPLHAPAGRTETADAIIEATDTEHADHEHADQEHADHEHAEAEHAEHGPSPAPPVWMVTPFVLLLGSIAIMPLLPFTEHWWESNLHRFYVAAGLGFLTLVYYAVLHDYPLDGHWPAHHLEHLSGDAIQWHYAWTVFANAILHEYIPFIVLLFSLYTISGGIRIQGDLPAHSLTNTAFIATGGLLASFVGTTGAAMLLIRPLLETNSERQHVRHTVIIFIFVVCNCGGLLLPIGDPPLFLGYLRGVPFLWTLNLWGPWLFVNGMLLAVYFLWDHFHFYPKEKPRDVVEDETRVRSLQFRGLKLNGLLLIGVILSVALLDPSKTLPGTDWHPWLYLREIVQLSLVGLSLLIGDAAVRRDNRFNFHAIVEVAALFLGIFICMQPALQILGVAGPSLGIDTPSKFFWVTGGLSSVLDNAPTYVVFFETARTLPSTGELTVAGVAQSMLVAISLGAVFMGAMTYIGNGPNFMVKAIAESTGVRMPSFFGYIVYSVCILLPILVLTNLIFL